MRPALNMLIFCCVASIILFSIYDNTKEKSEPIVDSVLSPYVDEWKNDCKSHGLEMTDDWWRLERIYAVYVYTDGDNRLGMGNRIAQTIQVKADYSDDVVKCIVYHELGHYVFRLDHCSESGQIMSETIHTQEDSYYGVNWQELKEEYFYSIKR